MEQIILFTMNTYVPSFSYSYAAAAKQLGVKYQSEPSFCGWIETSRMCLRATDHSDFLQWVQLRLVWNCYIWNWNLLL